MKTIMHNGVPCVKAKVHMLPTEDENSKIWIKKQDEDMIFIQHESLYPQHLYFTTEEEVILGDGKVFLYEGKTYLSSTSNRFDDFNMVKAKNIIASTDKSLPFNLPQIPQSFIEEYCKAGGIDKVDVEYEEFSLNGGGRPNATVLEPKLNPDNTIIIHPVEEKMYSKEELFKAFTYGFQNKEGKLEQDLISVLMDRFDKWVNSNSN